MKLKEIERTVNTSWSPAENYPILLAAGTAAQQLDASFSTSAALEIYSLNLKDPSLDLELKTTVPSQHRFHKLGWSGAGQGIIVGGCDNGIVQVYNVPKVLSNEEGLVANPERHTGAVKALDFNPFQRNLLATGSTNSEIYIWDMNNTTQPMTPGAKSQPFEDVAWLAWNRQVQHILASTFSTRSVVWDLRKNEPIIKLTDTTTRVRWKVVAWHPEVATQLSLASEEDSNPVVQLWDLRFATAPVKSFHGHNRGVLTLAWCAQDPDFLVSSGKDNKILCWNPNSQEPDGEIVCEIPNTQQWIFEVSWCPKNPSLLISSSCDGRTSIYSLTGSPSQLQTNTKIAESFPGMREYSEPQVPSSQHPTIDLKKAPKWMKRPAGTVFGFGGKLITFAGKHVQICRVPQDNNFIERSRQLEQKIQEGNYHEICRGKQDPIWTYLEASFSSQPRIAIRDLLGYSKESVTKMLGISSKPTVNKEMNHLAGQFSALGQDGYEANMPDGLGLNYNNSENLNGGDIFDSISMQQQTAEEIRSLEIKQPFKLLPDNEVDDKICKALLIGSIEDAITICLNEGKMADALVLASAAGPEVLAKTQRKYFLKREGCIRHILEGFVKNNWSSIVDDCELSSWKEALAIVLTYSSDDTMPSLCQKLGARLERAGGEYSSCADICYITSGHIAPLIHKKTSGITLNPDNIQELVELVLVAQGALQSRGQRLPIVGDVARLITEYAQLLASEGDLETALEYLNDSQDDSVVDLRERLYYALGHKTLYNTQPQQQMQRQSSSMVHQQPQQLHRKTSIPFQVMQNVPNQQIPTPPISSFGRPPSVSGGSISGSIPPVVTSQQNFGGVPPIVPKPSLIPHQQGITSHPPPPPPQQSFARNSPSPHVPGTTMKKYIVDPSVASSGFRAGGPHVYNTSAQMAPSSQPAVPMFGGPAFTPAPAYTHQEYGPGYGGQHLQQQQQQGPNPVNTYQSYKSPTPPLTQQPVPAFRPNQSNNVPFKPPGGTLSNAAPPPLQLSAQNNPPSGWNDPPSLGPRATQLMRRGDLEMSAVHSGTKLYQKKKSGNRDGGGKQKTDLGPQSPITHPLFSSALPQTEYPGQQFQSQIPTQQPFQPATPISAMHQPITGGYGDPPISMARPAEPTKPKAPIPQQYLYIQVAFDDLRNKCSSVSNNALVRRKLEDVTKKLELLYDNLREDRLTTATMKGLEQLVQYVNSSDYNSGLALISHMVTGSDFAQIATFMTGLKILLQTAQQLRIN
ncbi:COPII coat complex component secretory 31 isoform X2 [Rhodnius prolixus]|uniref:COPII coat complex component secretory 31 isoform X2 n=1 Tax=Rhodnius prolixus TaxID=13249 RepID=UPI003D18D088